MNEISVSFKSTVLIARGDKVHLDFVDFTRFPPQASNSIPLKAPYSPSGSIPNAAAWDNTQKRLTIEFIADVPVGWLVSYSFEGLANPLSVSLAPAIKISVEDAKGERVVEGPRQISVVPPITTGSFFNDSTSMTNPDAGELTDLSLSLSATNAFNSGDVLEVGLVGFSVREVDYIMLSGPLASTGVLGVQASWDAIMYIVKVKVLKAIPANSPLSLTLLSVVV